MELAIPLVVLGGMYIVNNNKSSQTQEQSQTNNKKQIQESFKSMGKPQNYLPNVNPIARNFPVVNETDLVDTVQEYPTHNQATNNYLDQNSYETKQVNGEFVDSNIPQIYSLTGNYMNTSEFKHNNMVPFTRAKLHGQNYNDNMAEDILDNYVGSGSQVIKKIEQAPLFKPQENVQWTHGAPNSSEFYQSRVNPAGRNNMVKPFESVHVGPGLNQGYTTEGSGGFNSGMEARNDWLPKTVDELRITTNPKEEFSLLNHEGPAQSHINNPGIIGKVEKYNPDSFFINTQDRWLTTTGEEKGPRLVGDEPIKPSNRNETTSYVVGTAGSTQKTANYAPSNYEAPKRPEMKSCDIPHSSAPGRGPITDGDANRTSHANYTNNRSLTASSTPQTFSSGFSGAVGAAIAPIMDYLRPSKKEEFSCNMRIYGNTGGVVPGNYVHAADDNANVTIKETTLYQPNTYIGNQAAGGGYKTAEQQAIQNQRDTTNCSTIGGMSSNTGPRSYDADYRQTNNDTKELTVVARTNQGNTQVFNPSMNVSIAKSDADRNNQRLWVPSPASTPAGPSVETYGKINVPQYYDQNKGRSRNESDMVEAFRKNPFTHSLTTAV